MNVQLVLFKEDGQRRDLEMKRDSVIIGRSGDCDFQIPLSVISRRHCKLTRKADKLYVKDLGSSNGTFLNDKRVLQSEVQPGDRLKVGPVVFTIVINGVPVDIEPVVTVLSGGGEADDSAAPKAAADSSVAAVEGVPDVKTNDGSGSLDLAGDSAAISLADSGSLDHDDLADSTPSPLAELEELAKQQKK